MSRSAELILIRGLPGTGKSTKARELIAYSTHKGLQLDYYEADQYFTDQLGNYNYDKGKIGNAHAWCKHHTYKSLSEDRSVVVANTFTTNKELYDYLHFAKDFECKLVIVEMKKEYGSVHNVPEETMQKMRKRWEEVDVELLSGIDYTIQVINE